MEAVKELQRDCTTCSICFNTFSKPTSLLCFHTFCFQCIEDYREKKEMDGDTAVCPMCRQDMPQTTEGLRALPVNFFVNRLIELKLPSEAKAQSSTHMCDSCGESKETLAMFCVECQETLCEDCVTAHKKVKISKEHQLVGFDAMKLYDKSQELKNKPIHCENHTDYKLDMYCETCSVAICLKCCMHNHKDHKFVDLGDAGMKSPTDLVRIITKVSEEISHLKVSVDEIDKKKESAKEQYNQMQDAVEERTLMIIYELESRKEKVLEEMKNNYSSVEVFLEELSQTRKDKIRSLEDFLNLCSELQEKGTDLELVLMSDKCKTRVAAFDSLAVDTTVTANIEHSFKPGTTEKNFSQRVKFLFGDINFKLDVPEKDGDAANETPSTQATDDAKKVKKPRHRNIKPKQGKEHGIPDDLETVDTCSVISKVSTKAYSSNSDDSENEDGTEKQREKRPSYHVKAEYCNAVGQAGSKPIQGMVLLQGKLYIARNSTSEIDVHDASSTSTIPEKQIRVHGLTNATDMIVDIKTNYIYVGDWSSSTVLKLDPTRKGGQIVVIKIPVAGRPNGLSLTPDGTILVSSIKEMKFAEYSLSGDQLRVVNTAPHKPRHMLKISEGQYIMASGGDETAFVISRISLDKGGQMRIHRQFGGPRAPPRFKLTDARHLALDGRSGMVYVAHCKENRILALDHRSLRFVLNIVDQTKVANPSRLFVDSISGDLFVGCLTGQLVKFNLEITEKEASQPRELNFRRGFGRARGQQGQRRPGNRRGRGGLAPAGSVGNLAPRFN